MRRRKKLFNLNESAQIAANVTATAAHADLVRKICRLLAEALRVLFLGGCGVKLYGDTAGRESQVCLFCPFFNQMEWWLIFYNIYIGIFCLLVLFRPAAIVTWAGQVEIPFSSH